MHRPKPYGSVWHGVINQGNLDGGIVSTTIPPGHCDSVAAMAHMPPDLASPGTKLHVDLGRSMAEAQVTALPFYKAK
jgi:glycine cleavage system aminomethyltransferase T